jgi:DNA-binding PadR family transcriptional regulator
MEKTEKLHMLAVLENCPMTIDRIRMALDKGFSLEPSLAALWKNLQRCRRQGLVSVEKMGRRNLYMITEKGKKRRWIIAERREKAFKDWLDSKYQAKEIKVQVSKPKASRPALVKRAVEVMMSLALCDALLSGNSDLDTLDFAKLARIYWQNEQFETIPHIAE